MNKQPQAAIIPPSQEDITSSLTYDVVLLPEPLIAKKAITLSNQLAKQYPTRFILHETDAIPHYSIYMAQLDEKGLAKAKEAIKKIADTVAPFTLRATHYWQDIAEGFFEIQYEKTPELIHLQEKIIEKINPLRQGRFLTNYPPGYTINELLPHLTGNALYQCKQYGYPEIGEDYRPHMTFTRLQADAENTEIALPSIPPETFEGVFPFIGLFIMGENGTCVKKIAIFSLRG